MLQDHHFQIAKSIVTRLQQRGFTAYFAGGWVRDHLMNMPSDDIDIASDASPQIIQQIFPKTIPVGLAFGIVIVVEDDHQFEVATFRKDKGYEDGRRPIGIEPGTPQEDALRRDFTINGMFFDPLQEKIYDYVEGKNDLRRGIIRAIGNPQQRFMEDRLRMIRAVRYSSRFHFPIEHDTLMAIKDHAAYLLPAVAIERIWQELQKMSQFAHFDIAIMQLHRLGLLGEIFPDLRKLSEEQMQDRLRHIHNFPAKTPTIAKILELFPSHTLEQKLALCADLKLSNEIKNFVIFFDYSMKLLHTHTKQIDDYEWAHFYAHPNALTCIKLAAAKLPKIKQKPFLSDHRERQERLQPHIWRIQEKKPVVTARHCLDQGIKPGKQLGQMLRDAEKVSINLDIENPEQVLKELKKTFID